LTEECLLSSANSEIPIARRPLQLSARSASTTAIAPSSNPATPSTGSSSKSNPFGSAKPIDTSSKEKEFEEKLAKQRAEAAEKKAAEPPKEEKKFEEREKKGSEDRWERKGPLAPGAQRKNSSNNNNNRSNSNTSNLPPPVPLVGKDEPPHTAASTAPWSKKEGTEEITKGVEETKI